MVKINNGLSNKVEFFTVKDGECFYLKDDLYVKLREVLIDKKREHYYSAYNYRTNTFLEIGDFVQVIPVKNITIEVEM